MGLFPRLLEPVFWGIYNRRGVRFGSATAYCSAQLQRPLTALGDSTLVQPRMTGAGREHQYGDCSRLQPLPDIPDNLKTGFWNHVIGVQPARSRRSPSTQRPAASCAQETFPGTVAQVSIALPSFRLKWPESTHRRHSCRGIVLGLRD